MSIKSLIFLTVLILFVGGAASGAQPQGSAASLDQLLDQVKRGKRAEQRVNAEREARFREAKQGRARLLAERRRVRKDAERRSEELEALFARNEKELIAANERLRARMGNLGEVLGVVRQVSGDTAAQLSDSLTSAQLRGRVEPLRELAGSTHLPSIESLENLSYVLLEEIAESGKVVRFTSPVVTPRGERLEQEVTRVGVFSATANGRFLKWDSTRSVLTELARQPERRHLRAAARMDEAQDGLVNMSVDPSRGAILGLLVQRSTLGEHLRHGGNIGYAIIALGAIGLLLVLERLIQLLIVGRRVEHQRASDRPRPDNPLGRILAVYEENPDVTVEALELKLDEAIQHEIPKIDRFLTTIRVFAVMAPLMGLLGTVTGMIVVFQDIQLFGSGDPKIMAGGISQALVTTVLGLLAAIPLLFFHSVLHGRAKGLMEILDEQSVGLVAARAERRVD